MHGTLEDPDASGFSDTFESGVEGHDTARTAFHRADVEVAAVRTRTLAPEHHPGS